MIDLRPDHLAVVLAILKAELPHTEIWAFGSRAKWTARDTSDLDLALKGNGPIPPRILARLRRAFEKSYLPFSVDLVDWSRLSEDFRSVISAQKIALQSAPTGSERNQDLSWRAVPLSECADFLTGSTPSRARKEYWNGDIPWVTAKDMKQLWLSDSRDHLTPLALTEGARLVPAGSVLVLVRGMLFHQELPICILERPMSFNQDLQALLPKANILPEYLAYTLLGNKAGLLSLVDAASHKMARMHLGSLASFPIALPPVSEQRAIAHVLGTLDDKIELNRCVNQTLEAMAHEIFNDREAVSPLWKRISVNVVESDTLSDLRNMLLPKLVSGEIRIKPAEKTD